jgi:hypothetical protein
MATKPLTETVETRMTRDLIRAGEKEALERAHQALICGEEKIRKGWTQRNFAVSDGGASVGPTSKRAVEWCALGALQACTPRKSSREGRARELAKRALEAAISEVSGIDSIVSYNDASFRKKAEVVGIFRRARTILKLLAKERGVRV